LLVLCPLPATRNPLPAEGVSPAMIQRLRLSRPFVFATIAVVGAAGMLATVSTVAARSAHREAARRPVILFLHGRGQLGRDTAEIRTEWLRSLETGVGKLTRQPLIDSSDVQLVWYADVLDPASSAACDPDTRSRSRQSGEDEGEVLQLLLGVTSTLFTSLYESMPEESRYSMRALVGDVMYLGDRWRRCAVDRRLELALAQAAREKRPIILVAHSFGSLVAYSYLRADRSPASSVTPLIHRYVTLGSMLGIPELQELLLGRAGPLPVPPGVRSWVNVRHIRDPFAAPLADTTESRRSSARIREVVTSANAVDPHDIVTYLRDPAAARAIAWAWCDAGGRVYAPACSDIRHDIP
jgi:pimeloyl-ACP methyl ester carboxylesterase